ncbi:MAG: uroporphyrinogen decarboxylase family protein, partial [bacterium]
DLLEEPALVEDILERIVAVDVGILERLAELGVDWLHTGDDFGAQRGLQYSVATWRKFFRPRYARIWGVAAAAGLPQSHHSCGDVRPILDDLVEIGLGMLNPVQTNAMPPEELADRWGERLAFWGGLDTQHVLPFGSPAEVRAFVDRCRATLGRRARWFIAPSHTITSEVGRESFFALLDALELVPAGAEG